MKHRSNTDMMAEVGRTKPKIVSYPCSIRGSLKRRTRGPCLWRGAANPGLVQFPGDRRCALAVTNACSTRRDFPNESLSRRSWCPWWPWRGVLFQQLSRSVRPFRLLGVVVLATVCLVSPLTKYFTSQFMVTNQRVIIRHGFLTRTSYEMILKKIESIAVNQSLSDRFLWGSGTLVITGTGGTKEEFPHVGDAVAFQEHLNKALQSA